MSSSSSSSSSSINPSISISAISSDPLFSTLLSFSALILLYFPRLLWTILFSPVFLLTGFLLLSLLRLGATQRSFLRQIKDQTLSQIQTKQEDDQPITNHALVPPSESSAVAVQEEDCGRSNDAVSTTELGSSELEGAVSCACFEESFVQWNVRAPLEVIYEEYEEGEDHDKDVSNDSDPEPPQVRIGIERYPSLSLYYPETDSDSSSDDEFPTAGAWDSVDDNVCFMWDEDEDRDELIEIALDKSTNKKPSEFQFEEDNLIEIDLSPTRNHEFPDVK